MGVNMVPQQGLAGSRVRTLNTTALKHQHRVGQLTDEQTDLKAPDGHKLLKQIFVHGLNCFMNKLVPVSTENQPFNQLIKFLSQKPMDQISLKGENDNLLFH